MESRGIRIDRKKQKVIAGCESEQYERDNFEGCITDIWSDAVDENSNGLYLKHTHSSVHLTLFI